MKTEVEGLDARTSLCGRTSCYGEADMSLVKSCAKVWWSSPNASVISDSRDEDIALSWTSWRHKIPGDISRLFVFDPTTLRGVRLPNFRFNMNSCILPPTQGLTLIIFLDVSNPDHRFIHLKLFHSHARIPNVLCTLYDTVQRQLDPLIPTLCPLDVPPAVHHTSNREWIKHMMHDPSVLLRLSNISADQNARRQKIFEGLHPKI